MTTKMQVAEPLHWVDRDMMNAFRRGDLDGMVQQVTTACGGDLERAIREIGQFAMELRRENVSMIGSHEAFVRRTEYGTLAQVVAPVKLSLHDDTLYQLPVWGKYRKGTGIPWNDGDGSYEWKAVVPEANRNKATITAFGLNRLNGVAGCAVGQPPVVIVDGVEKTNPYVERAPGSRKSSAGDIIRIVIAVNVVGPAPATGNPVVVQYTLDVDPGKDLQHMLMSVVKDDPTSAYLIGEQQFEDLVAEMTNTSERIRWAWLPLYGSVGIAHDLRCDAVQKAYTKYVSIIQNALKKSQTVVRRNAMRQHPALAVQTVRIDEYGNAVVPVIGWQSSERSIAKWAEIMNRMARGMPTGMDNVEVIEASEVYDPEDHVGDSLDADVDREADTEAHEANALILQIDEGIGLLSPEQVGSLDYRPGEQSEDELRAVLTAVNSMLDEAR